MMLTLSEVTFEASLLNNLLVLVAAQPTYTAALYPLPSKKDMALNVTQASGNRIWEGELHLESATND